MAGFVPSVGQLGVSAFGGQARSTAVAPRSASTPRVAKIRMDLFNGDGEKEMKELVSLEAGGKMPVCRCWKSKKFPACDGSHNAYNKETGDNLGPLVISVAKAE